MVNAINTVSPAPAPTASAPAAAPAEPGAFARELDRAAQEGDADTGTSDAATAPPAPAANARAKAKPAADGKTAARKPEQPSVAKDSSVTELGAERNKDNASASDSALPGDLQALLAGLLAHTPTPPSAAAGAAELKAGRADAAEAGGSAAALPGQALPQAADAAAAATAALPAFSLLQAAGAPAAPAEAAPPPPVHQAQVSAAVGTPEFAPGLSAEVTVMLRDGLQEARLQLNPAEMGPITVQIQIEGGNAQINLSAEQAPTRDALEQALPTLAGTLRDNGLTLTGGGVFEQPRQPRDDNPQPGGSHARGGSGSDSLQVGVSPGARQLTPRGVVDLYA